MTTAFKEKKLKPCNVNQLTMYGYTYKTINCKKCGNKAF